MTDSTLQLQHAILRTIAYFDVFEYPLKVSEVWRWLYRGVGETWTASTDEVARVIDGLVTDQRLERHDEFLCLPGRSQFIAQRQVRAKLNEKKWKRAKTVARFVEVFPFVKTAAVVNTLAIDNARAESDIDLLILCAPRRIWLSRFMVTGIVQLLGFRRHGEHVANRVCLSFYLTTSALDLAPLKSAPEDHHFAFWATQAVPLMDDGAWKKFIEANRDWTSRLPNAWDANWVGRTLKPNRALRNIKHFYENVFGMSRAELFEASARDRQMAKMEKNTTSKLAQGTTEVVVNEEVLKFHEDDRRSRYNALYLERCRRLGITP